MNMIEAVKSVLSQYIEFSGRARRSEFWYWQLATILASIFVAMLETLFGIGSDGPAPLSTLLSLAVFIPGITVSFRRLHDTGRSGWWIGGFYLGALVLGFVIVVVMMGMITGERADNEAALALVGIFPIFFVLAVVIYAIVLIVFFCQDSRPGPNKYGPNPKGEGNFDIFS